MPHAQFLDLLVPSLAVDWPGLSITHGDGSRVFGSSGRPYLDFVPGMTALPLGHAHPEAVAAISDQASRLTHGRAGAYHDDVLLLWWRGRTSRPSSPSRSRARAATSLPPPPSSRALGSGPTTSAPSWPSMRSRPESPARGHVLRGAAGRGA